MSTNATKPVFILKDPIDRKAKEDGKFRYASCVDGSLASLETINMIRKLRGPEDLI